MSWLVIVLRNMGIFHDISEELLRKSWKQFPGNPRNWFWRTFLWKFPRISTNFVDIFYGFSTELVTRKSLELVIRNSSEWVTRNSSDLVMRSSLELVTRSSSELLSTFLPNFPVKDSWEFSPNSQEFLEISADFPQNCYLGQSCNFRMRYP